MSAQPGRSRFITLSLYSLVTLIVAAASITLLKITEVYCYVEYANCSPEIAKSVRELKGQRLLLTNADTELKGKLSAYPTVRIKEISRVLPSSLVVRLESQTISFVLQEPATDETMLITESGQVLYGAPRPDWSVFLLEPGLFVEIKTAGRLDQARHQDLGAALAAIQTLEWSLTSLYIPDWQTLQLDFDDKPNVVFSLDEVENQVQRAKDVLLHTPIEELTQVQEVDLRYKLPVLRESISIPRHDSL